MVSSSLKMISEALLMRRVLPSGGFSVKTEGLFQVDSTAWSILALAACGGAPNQLDQSRRLLMNEQLPDGHFV